MKTGKKAGEKGKRKERGGQIGEKGGGKERRAPS